MSSSKEIVTQLLDTVCASKEDAARRKTGFIGAVLYWRGDERVAIAFPRQHDRDVMLDFARIGGAGFSADLVAIAFDSFIATVPTNPVTGQRWGPHEMQEVADKHFGREKGWVTDSISILAANRAGDQWMVQRNYREAFRRVTWDEPQVYSTTDAEGPQAGGVMSDTLTDIMVTMPTIDQLAARSGATPAAFGLTAEAGRDHMDCATVKMMRERDLLGAVLFAEPGTPRAEIIQRSLGEFLADE